MTRMGKDHPLLETWRLEALATVHVKEGNSREALAAFERALSLMEKTRGRDNLDYAGALMNKGVTVFDTKRPQEANGLYQQSAQLAAKVGGPEHPQVAMALANSAEALNTLHRYDEARSTALQALRTMRKAGTSKLHEGFVLSNVGEASLATGRPRDAAAEFEEAFRLLGDDPTPLREAARFGLARALWEATETRPRALALAREAAAAYNHLHIPDEAAKVERWLKGRAPRVPLKMASRH